MWGVSENQVDAIVIGAGPAGALAARGLALYGRSVLLVEKQKFPRPKVCGCCLNRAAVTSLERVGLAGLLEALGGRPLRELELTAGGRTAKLALPRGVALSRTALDGGLVKAAQQAGVVFRDGVSAKVRSLGSHPAEGHLIDLGRDESVRARVVVVADGLGGSSLAKVAGFDTVAKPASRLGFGGITRNAQDDAILPAGVIAMACGRRGYLGAVRLEDGRIDFAAAVDADAAKAAGGLPRLAEQLLDEAGVGRGSFSESASVISSGDTCRTNSGGGGTSGGWPLGEVEAWRATPTLTRRRARLAGPGLFVVGDAAGYVEPFTGEGMAWAIAGGIAVTEVAASAVEGWNVEQEKAWNALHRRRIRRRQLGCRVVAATLRRPRLTRGVVRLVAAWPSVAQPLIRRITRPHVTHTPLTPRATATAPLPERSLA